jgi:hypothetical protein
MISFLARGAIKPAQQRKQQTNATILRWTAGGVTARTARATLNFGH